MPFSLLAAMAMFFPAVARADAVPRDLMLELVDDLSREHKG